MSTIENQVTASDYDSPSWAFKQADRNGYLRALNEVYTLLKLKET